MGKKKDKRHTRTAADPRDVSSDPDVQAAIARLSRANSALVTASTVNNGVASIANVAVVMDNKEAQKALHDIHHLVEGHVHSINLLITETSKTKH